MPLKNFLLTLHIVGAIVIFGPSIAFAFIGAKAQKQGAPVGWAIDVVETISQKWILPLALTVIPGTGAGLIIVSDGAWDPFVARNRWLLVAIILYIIQTGYGAFVQVPTGRKALHMAQANQFGPEFGKLMKRVGMGGQLLTILMITIAVLMVVKPGSGFIHP